MMSYSRFIRSIHMGRIVPEIDPDLAEKITTSSVNAKHLSTRRNFGFIGLPAQVELAAQARIARFADSEFRKRARRFIYEMYTLKRPDDKTSQKIVKADIKTEFEMRNKIQKRPEYDPTVFRTREDEDDANFRLDQMIQGSLTERLRNWRYFEYDTYSSSLYMATRLAPNYACVKSVMNEIRDTIPDFEPNSVLDFGSGMGTTSIAVENTWPEKVNEYMNVDLSIDQHQLCEFLLRGGRENGSPLQGIYHRQYLPASTKARYDLVVSAFTLLELPNLESRTNMVENLWNKTSGILVLIERGNKGGFSVIDEMRNLILKLEGHDPVDRLQLSGSRRIARKMNPPQSHCVAPCPHEYRCPKIMMPKRDQNVCNFKVAFEPLELGERKPGITSEKFSYVILRRGPSPIYQEPSSIRWPRIVARSIKKSKHVIHRLCCPNGELAETTLTAKKYGKATYELAKSCDWGDVLPVKVCDTYRSKSSFNRGQIGPGNERSDSDDNK